MTDAQNHYTGCTKMDSQFSKSTAYDGWQHGLFALDWFDSEPERGLANLVGADKSVDAWVRLHVNELPIVWAADGRQYNADFIVVETNGDHWIVEVKADNQVAVEEVQAKRLAAKRWTNIVNVSDDVQPTWHYLLVRQTDITQATGSWAALKKLGT